MAIAVERLNPELEGEFTFRGRNCSTPFAVPGDRVQFRMERHGRKVVFVPLHIEKGESPSDLPLAEPLCPHYGSCGGCRGQHLDYKFQLELKSAPIRTAMKERFGIDPVLIPADSTIRYRNRMDFVVNGTTIGLRPAGDFSRFVDIERCLIQRENGDRILASFRDVLTRFPQLGFDRATGEGVIKYATIRTGVTAACILTLDRSNRHRFATPLQDFLEQLNGALPQSTTLILCETENGSELSAVSGGEAFHGETTFIERLGGIDFTVPYDSFFQPNPAMFDRLLDATLDAIGHDRLESIERVVDLYCGSGTLSTILNHRIGKWFKEIHGYDFVSSSIGIAAQAAEDHSFHFKTRDLNHGIDDREVLEHSDLVIADPPRAGLSPALKKELATQSNAPLLVYISCNPKSQLRDLADLAERYEPIAATIVDCFPFTPHLEQVVLLSRR